MRHCPIMLHKATANMRARPYGRLSIGAVVPTGLPVAGEGSMRQQSSCVLMAHSTCPLTHYTSLLQHKSTAIIEPALVADSRLGPSCPLTSPSWEEVCRRAESPPLWPTQSRAVVPVKCLPSCREPAQVADSQSRPSSPALRAVTIHCIVKCPPPCFSGLNFIL